MWYPNSICSNCFMQHALLYPAILWRGKQCWVIFFGHWNHTITSLSPQCGIVHVWFELCCGLLKCHGEATAVICNLQIEPIILSRSIQDGAVSSPNVVVDDSLDALLVAGGAGIYCLLSREGWWCLQHSPTAKCLNLYHCCIKQWFEIFPPSSNSLMECLFWHCCIE